MSTTFFCDAHGANVTPEPGSMGYGVDANGRKACYACCAIADCAQMERDGKTTLYLVSSPSRKADRVTNWPGSLSFRVVLWSEYRHPFGPAIVAYFKDDRGAWWSARNIGDTQIAHCRRLALRTVKALNLK